MDKQIRIFAERYVKQHYDIDTFSVESCERREEGPDVWFEVTICYGENDSLFTLYLKSIDNLCSVHYVDGTVPEQIYTLVPSTNPGRYALDDPETGRDISSGEPLRLWLGGNWIVGRVEHSALPTAKYPDATGAYSITGKGLCIGYYFIASEGGVTGLCVGMRVKKGY